jgi:hypothetical protein
MIVEKPLQILLPLSIKGRCHMNAMIYKMQGHIEEARPLLLKPQPKIIIF